jgi:hypothetical protein
MTHLIARIRGPVAFWAVAGVALLVSHDAVFLAQVGPGHALARALREAGHEYWGIASLLLGIIGLATLGATLLRLRALRRKAATLGATPIAGSRPYVVRWLATWGRLLAMVAIGFVVQENIEHLVGHGHAPGLGALIGPEYPLALPVITLITGLAALVAAALSQAERALLAVIADAMRRVLARAPRRTDRPPQRLVVRLMSPLARAWAGRAPPRVLVSVS